MGRKVFISILGTGAYKECVYEIGDFKCKTRFIQEATMKYLINDLPEKGKADKWGPNDKACIFVTKGDTGSEKLNWNTFKDEIRIDKNNKGEERTTPNYKGLGKVLENIVFPLKPYSIQIDDGLTTERMWSAFSTIYDEIEDGDELYIDLTHGFRYLPMLLLVLCNYAKFLKNVTVKSVTYGNFEFKSPDGTCPIMDLLPLVELQDWTYAAANFLRSGDAENLAKLNSGDQNFTDQLQIFADDMKFCRGKSLLAGDSVKRLRDQLEQLKLADVAFTPISAQIDKELKQLVTRSRETEMFNISKLCLKKKQYQSALTILDEAVISFFCKHFGLNEEVQNNRDFMNSAFSIKCNNKNHDKWRLPNKDACLDYVTMKSILKDELFCDETLISALKHLQDIRNDFAHAGMRNDPRTSDELKTQINESVETVISKLGQTNVSENILDINRDIVLVNYTNLKSEDWSENQKNAAKDKYIVDLIYPEMEKIPVKEDKYNGFVKSEINRIIESGRDKKIEVVMPDNESGLFSYSIISRLLNLNITCYSFSVKSQGSSYVFIPYK